MAETTNIAEIAARVSNEIFKFFLWSTHPKRDDNFKCANPEHKSAAGAPKSTHPGDVVFSYDDPYLRRRTYLHTDLKSYADSSITSARLKDALASLCMTVECASQSESWRDKYLVDAGESHEVRGLLFVHNYTKGREKAFSDALAKVKLDKLPVAAGNVLHFLGPRDINRLWSIANDIMRLTFEKELPETYTFYYPDLMLHRRHGDVWGQAATIESLTSPYLILKHGASAASKPGYVVYFNRPGATAPALEYFIDSLSRFQMLDSAERIRIRCTSTEGIEDVRSHFEAAKHRYARAWGFDSSRIDILNNIEVSSVTSVTDTFNPGATGWRT
jgi:hypothetical protein